MSPRIAVFFLLGFVGFLERAQATEWTWPQALATFLDKNPELNAANQNFNAAQNRYLGLIGSKVSPSLSANASHTQTLTSGSDSSTFNWGISASYNLFNGFADVAALSSGRIDRDLRKIDLLKKNAELLRTFRNTWAETRYALELSRLFQEILKRQQENLRLVTMRFEGGRENKGSQLLLEANVAQAELDLLAAQNQSLRARLSLNKLLADPNVDASAPESLQLAEGSNPNFAPLPESPDLEALLPHYVSWIEQQLQNDQLKARLATARAEFMPKLDASFNVSRSGDRLFAEQNEWQKSFMLSLSLPLFEGFNDVLSYRAQMLENRANQLNLGAARESALISIQELFDRVHEALMRTKVSVRYLKAAEVRSQIARARYTSGLVSFEDWDVIEQDLINRQKATLESQRDYVTALANWDEVLGVTVESSSRSSN